MGAAIGQKVDDLKVLRGAKVYSGEGVVIEQCGIGVGV
jgi:hypothetical protein